LNIDGVPELYGTGFLQNGPNDEDAAGRSWVFDGRPSIAEGRGVLLREYVDPFLGPNRAFGWALSQTDYNRDGRIDSYVSNLQGQVTTTSIFDGRNGLLLRNLGLGPLAQRNLPIRGPGAQTNNGSSLGWSSRAPGDLNRDGEPDYVAAAPYQDVNGKRDQGKVFFFLSNTRTPAGPRPNYYPPPSGGCPSGTSAGVTCQSNGSGGLNITGTAGNDTTVGTTGNDVINCGAGDDVVNAGPGDDVINCGAGNDRVNGGAGNDRINGESGNDLLSGNEGNDRVVGGSGNERANGNEGNDRVGGGSGNDRVGGQSGRDTVNGDSGRDRVSGGSSNDRVSGGRGNDRVNGDSGNDRVNGGSGRDRLSGAGGNDSISARDRTRDTVNCGRGRDSVSADRRRGRDRVSRNCERVRRR